MLCYHVQQIMLADYMWHSRPVRVLEFGCGVGRHLRYLSQMADIDVYGYDQSASMVEGCLRWTTPEWVAEHIVVGDPAGRLPYPDKYFDIVYTVEVLIHVSPEDLSSVLAELVRISRWQVLHLEPSRGVQICEDAHDGSWNHDLVAAYHQLGYTCEPLPSGYSIQQPYRVILDRDRPVYTWPQGMLRLLRKAESDIQPTIDQLLKDSDSLRSQLVSLQTILAEEQERARDMQQRLKAALAEEQERARDMQQRLEAALAEEQERARDMQQRLEAALAEEQGRAR
ncbi:MAG: methyltransferase domain-containing protein, partial [Roseiflexaceae bacterium]|nr:methyltransferase domain-containing protein [Roseiflexaceae bacterium]